MSTLGQALLINVIVLAAVLEADIGRHRKIGWFRLARPLVLAGAIVPIYLKSFADHGTGLTLEVGSTVAGLVLGVIASALMHVYRSPKTGRAVSRAGLGYATLWVVVIGARTAFSYGSEHWFKSELGSWLAQHMVDANAITDSLILMAVAMLVTRTLGLAARAAALHDSPARPRATLQR